jgi:hypothetical protein
MRVGMLWFDDSTQRDLDTKIGRAASHYKAKYGMSPTTCYVHPSMLLEGTALLAGMDVRANNMILPNHFWLGIGDGIPAETRSAA